jgi:hypothetical protein
MITYFLKALVTVLSISMNQGQHDYIYYFQIEKKKKISLYFVFDSQQYYQTIQLFVTLSMHDIFTQSEMVLIQR